MRRALNRIRPYVLNPPNQTHSRSVQYTTLPRTDLEVSKICLGTMTFGEQNTEAEGHEQMDYALDRGVNFFDTAELYAIPPRPETQGLTEQYIGTWFAQRNNRERVVLASKIVGPSPNLTHIRKPMGFEPDMIHEAVEGSLQRLQTDYIDLYQLHWPERATNSFGKRGYRIGKDTRWTDNFHAVLETMEDLVRAGKIRYWGLSNETPWGLNRCLQLSEQHDLPRPRTVQNPYSLLNRLYEVGLSEISLREDVGLLAYSPLGMGMLSGKYHNNTARPEARLVQFKKNYPRYLSEESYNATAGYLQIAEDYGLTPTQLALAFVHTRPFLTSNIIGATTMDQLRENIATIDVEVTREMEKRIDEVQEKYPNPAP